MRLFSSVLSVLALLVAGNASAVTMIADPTQTTINTVGDTVTVGVRVVLDEGDSINALGASAFGWDESVINFVSGQAVGELFFQSAPALQPGDPTCDILPSACLPADPIDNSRGPALSLGAATPGLGNEGDPEVEYIAAISLTDMFGPTAFDDPGLDGNPGTAQFEFVFQAVGLGVTTLEFGGGLDLDSIAGGNNVSGYNNATVEINVIPEPGTALLMGLGLTGLAFAGRRQA